jgi:uncharacterized protein
MSVSLKSPGIYIEEVPSGVRTIVGVSTSTTAFVGRAWKGPVDVDGPVLIHGFGEYERIFGGLWSDSTMSFAVQQYFANGGRDAVIVRVIKGGKTATFKLKAGSEELTLVATSPGTWGDNLQISVNHDVKDEPAGLFNLVISDPAPGGSGDVETLRNLSVHTASPSFVTDVLEQQSRLVRVSGSVPTKRPDATDPTKPPKPNPKGDNGEDLDDTSLKGKESDKTGIYALLSADIFNLLCIPPLTPKKSVGSSTYVAAAEFCNEHRALLLIDPPGDKLPDIKAHLQALGAVAYKKNAALFFPRLRVPNPLKNNLLETFAPCGAVAGVFARTDAQRGIWKAPAGQEAVLNGVSELAYTLTDGENGDLNPLGINALRTFPFVGSVVWGARTLDGADKLASEWKYIPVRRLALFIEETLYRNTRWVVFEPNDEPLWSQIRLNVGAFMADLFRQGAFQGQTPQDAYFVRCDSETTTQSDINKGIVNILVGFAPLKPAEFVVIRIQQMAGQLAA